MDVNMRENATFERSEEMQTFESDVQRQYRVTTRWAAVMVEEDEILFPIAYVEFRNGTVVGSLITMSAPDEPYPVDLLVFEVDGPSSMLALVRGLKEEPGCWDGVQFTTCFPLEQPEDLDTLPVWLSDVLRSVFTPTGDEEQR